MAAFALRPETTMASSSVYPELPSVFSRYILVVVGLWHGRDHNISVLFSTRCASMLTWVYSSDVLPCKENKGGGGEVECKWASKVGKRSEEPINLFIYTI